MYDYDVCYFADSDTDHVRAGRMVAPLPFRGTGPHEAGAPGGHVPDRGQHGYVDRQHAGEEPRTVPPDPPQVLRSLGLDDHHAHLHAHGNLLQVPFHHLPV